MNRNARSVHQCKANLLLREPNILDLHASVGKQIEVLLATVDHIICQYSCTTRLDSLANTLARALGCKEKCYNAVLIALVVNLCKEWSVRIGATHNCEVVLQAPLVCFWRVAGLSVIDLDSIHQTLLENLLVSLPHDGLVRSVLRPIWMVPHQQSALIARLAQTALHSQHMVVVILLGCSADVVVILYKKAVEENPVDQRYLDLIEQLDDYVIKKFRVAFGNRIIKQLKIFVPVYVACGGDVLEGIDHILATKVFRKFEMLNLALIRDEIKGLINYLNTLFGKDKMKSCIEFLDRLQRTY